MNSESVLRRTCLKQIFFYVFSWPIFDIGIWKRHCERVTMQNNVIFLFYGHMHLIRIIRPFFLLPFCFAQFSFIFSCGCDIYVLIWQTVLEEKEFISHWDSEISKKSSHHCLHKFQVWAFLWTFRLFSTKLTQRPKQSKYFQTSRTLFAQNFTWHAPRLKDVEKKQRSIYFPWQLIYFICPVPCLWATQSFSSGRWTHERVQDRSMKLPACTRR